MMMTNKYIIKNEYAILQIISRKFGIVEFIIDKEDVNILKKFRWAVAKRHHGIYAMINTHPLPEICLLHRLLVKCPKNMVVDHINRNTLDNRKSNLRICTCAENNNNASKQYSKLGLRYIHLCKDRQKQKYHVEVGRIYRKRFYSLKDAIIARNKFIEEYRPELWKWHSEELLEDLDQIEDVCDDEEDKGKK